MGSGLPVLTQISQDGQKAVGYLLVLPQILTITFPSHPYLPGTSEISVDFCWKHGRKFLSQA